MALTTRTAKGTPLTIAEMDDNLKLLNNLFIQDTAPTPTSTTYMWIQTNVGGVPSDFTIWIEDGL